MADDDELMREAIAAGWTARHQVSPRPWVGAVVVTPEGRRFSGATQGRHGAHAEVVALQAAEAAGATLEGATMAVTLEPCAHHGLTPPCAEAIVTAGVRRVVLGVRDPDPRVAGRGVAILSDAGVAVQEGVRAAEVRQQLRPYLHHRRTGRPYVVLKAALSMDGRIAAPDGTSQWITGAEARLDAHRLRAHSDAIAVGAGTVRADDPALTVRLPDGEATGVEPVRVVLGHAPVEARVHPCLELSGDPGDVLDELGRRGVLQLLVEGGARVAHDFHSGRFVDRYVLYLAPCLFGGDDARGVFAGSGAPTLDSCWRGHIAEVRQLGSDLCVELEPAPLAEPA